MSVIAFDVNEVRDHYLNIDREKTSPFQLGTLDSYQRAHVLTQFSRDGFFGPLDAVRLGLKGWSLKDKNGAFIPFKTETVNIPGIGEQTVVTKKCLDYIQPYINELSVAIIKNNQLDEGDSKNSDTL